MRTAAGSGLFLGTADALWLGQAGKVRRIATLGAAQVGRQSDALPTSNRVRGGTNVVVKIEWFSQEQERGRFSHCDASLSLQQPVDSVCAYRTHQSCRSNRPEVFSVTCINLQVRECLAHTNCTNAALRPKQPPAANNPPDARVRLPAQNFTYPAQTTRPHHRTSLPAASGAQQCLAAHQLSFRTAPLMQHMAFFERNASSAAYECGSLP